jgi:hypothetical protein
VHCLGRIHALSTRAKEAIWLKKLLHELQILDPTKPTILMCDNQSAIKLSKNPVFRDCTKHIAIRHHFIREKVSEKDIEVIPVASSDQMANIFTKPLGRTLF